MTDSFASGHRQHDRLATPRLHPGRVISSRRSRSVPKSAAGSMRGCSWSRCPP